MVTVKQFRELVLTLPEVEEGLRKDIATFKVGKKVFATLNVKENRCCLKFTQIDQSVFLSFNKEIMMPVPNVWGKQGWTLVPFAKIKKDMLVDAVTTAYCTVAQPKLAQQFLDNYQDE